MKKWLLLLLIVATPAMAGSIADTTENRVAAAVRYMAAVQVETIYENAIKEMAEKLPEEKRPAFEREARGAFGAETAKRITLSVLIRNFTAGELNALADFFSLPEGRSAVAKLRAAGAEISQACRAEMDKPAMDHSAK